MVSLPPDSMIPVMQHKLQKSSPILGGKNYKSSLGTIGGPGEDNSWKKPAAKNLVNLSF